MSMTVPDPQRLYRPNEVLVASFLVYGQWGLLAVAGLALAKDLLVTESANPGVLVFVAIAFGLGYLGKLLRRSVGEWTSTRLRLLALTHRSVEVVITADAVVGDVSIEVQAEYARSRGSDKHRRTELLWRSPATTVQPLRTSERVEYRARIAMPAEFPEELELDAKRWRRSWRITVKVAPSRSFNFNFNVPASAP
jgi:hypothetical protein